MEKPCMAHHWDGKYKGKGRSGVPPIEDLKARIAELELARSQADVDIKLIRAWDREIVWRRKQIANQGG